MLGKTRRAEKECTEFARYIKLRLDLESVFDTNQNERGEPKLAHPRAVYKATCSLSPALVISHINFFLTEIVYLEF